MNNNPWLSHLGEVINERYPLLELLHSDDDSGVFRTESHGRPGATLIHILRVSPDDSNAYLSRWRVLKSIDNAHIMRIFDSGTVEFAEDGSVIFYVTEEPDDLLATALAGRALSEEETRQLAESLAEALDAMHTHGLMHGRLRPDTVFAVGDQIKISGDGVAPDEDASAATDMNDYGLLLLACLRRKVPTGSELAGVIASLPEPFREIVERTVDADPQKRWTAARVRAALRSDSTPDQPKLLHVAASSQRIPGNTVKYAAVTAAAVLLGFVGIEWMRSPGPQPQAASLPEVKPSPIASSPVTPPPSTVTPQKPVRTSSAPKPVHTPAPKTVRTPPPKPRTEDGRSRVTTPTEQRPATGGHLVVIATYNRQADAEKRARSISAKFPKFPATVLAPHEPNPPYFVILGANLSKEAAIRLQQRARASGLPRDAYVTR